MEFEKNVGDVVPEKERKEANQLSAGKNEQ